MKYRTSFRFILMKIAKPIYATHFFCVNGIIGVFGSKSEVRSPSPKVATYRSHTNSPIFGYVIDC